MEIESHSLKPVKRALANEGILYVHVKTPNDIASHSSLDAAPSAWANLEDVPWAQVCDVLINILERHVTTADVIRCNIGELSMICKRFDSDVYSVIVYTKGHSVVKSINRIAERMMRKISRSIRDEAGSNRPVGAGYTGLVN